MEYPPNYMFVTWFHEMIEFPYNTRPTSPNIGPIHNGPQDSSGQVWGHTPERPPCNGTPSASVWPSSRQTPVPPCPQLALTWSNVRPILMALETVLGLISIYAYHFCEHNAITLRETNVDNKWHHFSPRKLARFDNLQLMVQCIFISWLYSSSVVTTFPLSMRHQFHELKKNVIELQCHFLD